MICKNCEHCKRQRRRYASRYTYFCEHENQRYILDYFAANKIQSMPGFLGYSKSTREPELGRKTSPRWCPLRIEE